MASLVPELGTMYRVWLKQEVDPGFREELMLAVSRLNGCRFCSWGHHEWAQISGVPDEELARLEQLDPTGFNRRKWIAISYVRALVKEDFERVQPELRRAMQHKYSPAEIRQIELIAKVMDLGNRSSNTFDAMLSRLKGVPATDSRIIDEVILSGAFLTIAPMVRVPPVARGEAPVPRNGPRPDRLHEELRRQDRQARDVEVNAADAAYDADLLVIGGGSGGVRAARMAAARGARVVLAEAGGTAGLGGTCVNVGCIPKKLYSYAAHYAESFEESHGFGWQGTHRGWTGAG